MEIPLIYQIFHYIFGMISFKYKWIILPFLIYQFIQFFMNIRFFLLDKDCYIKSIRDCFKYGNSLKHTLNKIIHFFIGYFFFMFICLLFKAY